MPHKYMIEGHTEFLSKDSKLEKCDGKSSKNLDSRSNPYQEGVDNKIEIGINAFEHMMRGQLKGV